ncbi:MAG TPA: hypothetical protein VGH42_13900 [Verrucomicrobiae bacterium]|jgi:hypothetical protein
MKAFFIFSHGIQHPMTRGCKIYVTLPIAASRTVATIGFPDPSLQGFSPKVLAHGHHGGNRVAVRRGG